MFNFKDLVSLCGLALGLAVANPVHAQCAPAESEILRSFQFNSVNREFCTPNTLDRKVIEALSFLKNLHWTPVKDELVQGIIGAEPYSFFRERITKIVVEPSGTGSRCDNGKTLAFNVIGDREMHVCELARSYSTFFVAEVLMHESRHSDGDGYYHYDCKTGQRLIGGGACDESYEAGGAYAVSAEFSVLVSRDPSLPDAVRREARAEAFNHFLTRFYTRPLNMQAGVFLQDVDGHIQFFDGTNSVKTSLNVNRREQILALKNHRLLLFDPKQPLAADLSYSGQMFVAVDALSKYYRERLTTEERARILDFYYGENYSCVLLSDSLRCISENEEVKRLTFTTIHPRGFLDVTQSSSLREGGLYLGDDKGNNFALPMALEQLRNLTEADLTARVTASPLINLAYLGENQIALDRNGTVGLYYPSERKWTSPFPGKKFVKLLGLVYWSKTFDAL